jgi:uncharacterized membrane protein (DUF106 family)
MNNVSQVLALLVIFILVIACLYFVYTDYSKYKNLDIEVDLQRLRKEREMFDEKIKHMSTSDVVKYHNNKNGDST